MKLRINYNELIGKQFGSLVITGVRRSSNKNKYMIVKCVFHPEEEFEVRYSDLKRNHTVKCTICRNNILSFSPSRIGLKREYIKFKNMIKHAKNNGIPVASKYNPKSGEKNNLKAFSNFYIDMVNINAFPLPNNIDHKTCLSRKNTTNGFFKSNLNIDKRKNINRKNSKVVLNEELIKLMYDDRLFGFTFSDLSHKYNIPKSTIHDAINKKTWNDI